MRIVAGLFKGRRLATPRGKDVRPTADRVREALFSILGDIEGVAVLDAFAGTGAMGLEAVSRGASSATFIEIDRQAHEVVSRNVDATISTADVHSEVIKGDAARVIPSLALAGRRFDLIFFDPPYERTADLVATTIDTLPTICSRDARVVVEVSARHEAIIDQAAQGWQAEVLTKRNYGETTIAVLSVEGQPSPDPSFVLDDDDHAAE